MPENNDTIAAIATPQGRGGIGVIRISGSKSKDIYKSLTGHTPTARQFQHVSFKSSSGEIIDKGVALYFEGPASYTGEDVVECQAHGSRVLLGLLLEEIFTLGAIAARPGEFTERGFLNGKIDLVQAEAVADLIDSNSKKAARSAIQSLEGAFSKKIHDLRDIVFNARSLLEAALDFPDEDDVNIDIGPAIDGIEKALLALNALLKKAEAGRVLAQSPTVAIVGSPNAGKSSLINSLSGYDSAIVSDIEGTTRDVIREKVLLKGFAVTLLDTAGLRETKNEIEREGVERSYKVLANADLVLHVIDNSLSRKDECSIKKEQLSPGARIISVMNKIDLCKDIFPENTNNKVFVSAKTGTGMDDLVEKIISILDITASEEDMVFARQRHIEALVCVKNNLQEALSIAKSGEGIEVLAEIMRQALSGFDEVTGKTTSDDVLGHVFSQFCIGK